MQPPNIRSDICGIPAKRRIVAISDDMYVREFAISLEPPPEGVES